MQWRMNSSVVKRRAVPTASAAEIVVLRRASPPAPPVRQNSISKALTLEIRPQRSLHTILATGCVQEVITIFPPALLSSIVLCASTMSSMLNNFPMGALAWSFSTHR